MKHNTFIKRSVCSVAALAALGGAGLAAAPGAHALTAPPAQTVNYTGGVQWVTVPQGVDRLSITATGGDGGAFDAFADKVTEGTGAVVSGSIAVVPGQKVAISVGGEGQIGGTGSSDPHGGWGGLGMNGGNGNGASDHQRTSGAGGGATTIQIENADGSDLHTILIAGGGGGTAGPSGDEVNVGVGGNAGAGWGGQNGTTAFDPMGGSGGHAATQTDGVGERGLGGSGLGGNGGGGGGGLEGGSGGGGAKGTSAGGGGGSGSSATYGMTGTSITQRWNGDQQIAENGQVVLTWLA